MQIYARDQKESLVRKYLAHLNHLEMMSGKRKMEKKNKNLKENTMSYEEFDWMEMLNSGTPVAFTSYFMFFSRSCSGHCVPDSSPSIASEG